MKSIRSFLFTLCALLAATVATGRDVPGGGGDAILINGHPAHPARVLAKLKTQPGLSAHAASLSENAATAARGYDLVPGLVVLELEPLSAARSAGAPATPEARLQERIEALRATGLYEYVEPDYLWSIQRAPLDDRFRDGNLWGLKNTGAQGGVAGVDIGAEAAWDVTTGSREVVVAVIDTGVRFTHEDLAENMWHNPREVPGNGVDDDGNGYVDDVFGINAIDGSGDPGDRMGHGTHVAGTIGAVANNGFPHVGVAWEVSLMALKFIGPNGYGDTADAIECIDYAVAHGARVLNFSWGGAARSQALYDALENARAAGVLAVAAAGNERLDIDRFPQFPAAYDLANVISVTAIGRDGAKADFANFGGSAVDLAAPGVDIFSTLAGSDSDYGLNSGTSMAAPHVAGVAALLWSDQPGRSVLDVRDRILNTVMEADHLRGVSATGGWLDAHRALTAGPSGRLWMRVSPADGADLFSGRAFTVAVDVFDLERVTGAVVSARLAGGGVVVLRDDGVAPDAVADDGRYTGTMVAPQAQGSVVLRVTASAAGKSPSEASVQLEVLAAPANDAFANRIVLSSPGVVTAGNNYGASLEPGEPAHGIVSGGASVWWTWTAPANGNVTVSVDGADFDPLIAVYSGSELSSLETKARSFGDENGPKTPPLDVSFTTQAGAVYQIAVDGISGHGGPFRLRIVTDIAPANDDLANARVLSGDSGVVQGTLLNATLEPGEPDHGDWAHGGSVWFAWTPQVGGAAEFIFNGPAFRIYRGGTIGALEPVATYRNGTSARCAVEAGTRYSIAVVDYEAGPGWATDFSFEYAVHPRPANDDFENRARIEGETASVAVDNTWATPELADPLTEPAPTVWWTWTAPRDGTAVITSTRDTGLRVYTGETLPTLVEVASNARDFWNATGSRVVARVAAGQAYQILVTGYPHPERQLNIALIDGPPNDHFENAARLEGENIRIFANNNGATRQDGEPFPTAYGSNATLWWRWTAPKDGTVDVHVSSGTVSIFRGDSLESLETVVQNGNFRPTVSFSVRAGEDYLIWYDGVMGWVGKFELTVDLFNAPPNDNFADRIRLVGTYATASGTG